MLQADHPDTFVLATGRTESVRDFVRLAFAAIGVELEFRGEGDTETAVVSRVDADGAGKAIKPGHVVVRVDPRYYRPAEVDLLIGDASKAKRELGWEATTTLETLCSMMVEADLRRSLASKSY